MVYRRSRKNTPADGATRTGVSEAARKKTAIEIEAAPVTTAEFEAYQEELALQRGERESDAHKQLRARAEQREQERREKERGERRERDETSLAQDKLKDLEVDSDTLREINTSRGDVTIPLATLEARVQDAEGFIGNATLDSGDENLSRLVGAVDNAKILLENIKRNVA